MASTSKPRVNLRSTAVKRIMQEAAELAQPDEDDFVAGPLESDIFEWHCTVRGVAGSEYDGGIYHLRIVLPASYPMSAPDIILLTPNGRFELGKKICIDGLTSFHAGSWQPAWGVRTAITGLRSFWMQGGEAMSAIGALDCPRAERVRLAKLSRQWTCPTCGVPNEELLPDAPSASHAPTPTAPPAPTDVPAIDAALRTASMAVPSAIGTAAIPAAAAADTSLSAPRTPSTPAVASPPMVAEPSAATHQPASPASIDHADVALPAAARPSPTVPEPSNAAPAVVPAVRGQTGPAASPAARPPKWLDALIAVCIAALLGLVARRM